MKEIKPTYVDFKTAKWLKEKGFNEPCDSIYKEDGEFQSYKNFGDIRTHFKNNEPINPKTWHRYDTSAPEQWQVVEWLRVNHGIWITPIPRLNSWIFSIVEVKTSNHYSLIDIDFYGDNDYLTSKGIPTIMMSPQEAYSAAFDYIKDNELI
jgi:hypothetical protein